jgi:hypothetical protein
MLRITMLRAAFFVAFLQWSHQSANAIAGISYIVGCSTIKATSNFLVCATSDYASGGLCDDEACQTAPVASGRGYTITQGLKGGTDLTILSEAKRKKALRSGIRVQVNSLGKSDGPIFNCTVTVQVQGKSSKCKACQYCGDQKFSADCTNVARGRKAQCELATSSDIYFPLQESALSAPPPPPIKAPVQPLVRAPVRAPTK